MLLYGLGGCGIVIIRDESLLIAVSHHTAVGPRSTGTTAAQARAHTTQVYAKSPPHFSDPVLASYVTPDCRADGSSYLTHTGKSLDDLEGT